MCYKMNPYSLLEHMAIKLFSSFQSNFFYHIYNLPSFNLLFLSPTMTAHCFLIHDLLFFNNSYTVTTVTVWMWHTFGSSISHQWGQGWVTLYIECITECAQRGPRALHEEQDVFQESGRMSNTIQTFLPRCLTSGLEEQSWKACAIWVIWSLIT